VGCFNICMYVFVGMEVLPALPGVCFCGIKPAIHCLVGAMHMWCYVLHICAHSMLACHARGHPHKEDNGGQDRHVACDRCHVMRPTACTSKGYIQRVHPKGFGCAAAAAGSTHVVTVELPCGF
jgi:hypothetical protein